MEIQFLGGAQTVTGSQHLLSVNGYKILLECGLFQGRRKDTYERNKSFEFDPATVDAVLLSHAHIDHSGNIPNLVKSGYTNPIYATSATVDLCQIMLRDSAYLQEKDVEWVNKKRHRKGLDPIEPLYTIEDAEEAMHYFVGMQYDRTFQVVPGVQATFRDAGHILGSAGIELELRENGNTTRLGFSGDVGRQDMPIIHDPNKLRELDVLIMESTYGDRLHKETPDVEEDLAQTVKRIAERGGKIIIPAFAVGRTQMIVYMLHKLFDQGRIPDMPIYVDSPLARAATQVFRTHPECLDRETFRIFLQDETDPFGFSRLYYTRDVEESKRLNQLKTPHMIISASGMAEGGRILHHLRNNIENEKNLILFVGYAAEHTLARRIMDGEPEVRIFGEPHTVRAEVKKMDDFSAHADRNELVDYLEFNPPDSLERLFLVHGEPRESLPFRDHLKEMGYAEVDYPKPGSVYSLG